MKGRYEIKIWNSRIKYNFILKRNVTIIQGDSGTGKTTLYGMVLAMTSSRGSGVRSNYEGKLVAAGILTKRTINEYRNKIIVVDETCDCLYQEWFTDAVREGENYFLIITRGILSGVAYSVREIYGLTTRREGEVHVTELYQRYADGNCEMDGVELVITEDSNAGYEMMAQALDCQVVSAKGNGNVYRVIGQGVNSGRKMRVVVDGAAFGAFVNKVGKLCQKYHVSLFAPESFEYLVLKSEPFGRFLRDELENTYDYCDSKEFLSWERYYTWLLDEICYNKFPVKFHYSKKKLPAPLQTNYFFDYIRHVVLGIDTHGSKHL